jgi:hypothetical protein
VARVVDAVRELDQFHGARIHGNRLERNAHCDAADGDAQGAVGVADQGAQHHRREIDRSRDQERGLGHVDLGACRLPSRRSGNKV